MLATAGSHYPTIGVFLVLLHYLYALWDNRGRAGCLFPVIHRNQLGSDLKFLILGYYFGAVIGLVLNLIIGYGAQNVLEKLNVNVRYFREVYDRVAFYSILYCSEGHVVLWVGAADAAVASSLYLAFGCVPGASKAAEK